MDISFRGHAVSSSQTFPFCMSVLQLSQKPHKDGLLGRGVLKQVGSLVGASTTLREEASGLWATMSTKERQSACSPAMC